MRKIIWVIMLALIVACSPKVVNPDGNNINNDALTSGVMKNMFEDNYTIAQFDSICNADSISNDLKEWHVVGLRDFETRQNVTQYLYIKELYNGKESIYRLQKLPNGKYRITKRVVF